MIPIKDHNPSYKFPLVTLIIIAINVFIFFIELTAVNLEAFFNQYALVPANINWFNLFTYWPIFTSMFLHGGWLHIISNMWFLWIFGDNIEATLGHGKFLLFYLISGIGATLLQYVINPLSAIPMLGASGAIAGVLGGYLVFFPQAKIETLVASFGGYLTKINLPASFMLLYWFITQLFSGVGSMALTSDMGGVAFMAHVGGFITGWILAKRIKSQLDWIRVS